MTDSEKFNIGDFIKFRYGALALVMPNFSGHDGICTDGSFTLGLTLESSNMKGIVIDTFQSDENSLNLSKVLFENTNICGWIVDDVLQKV